ncbi:MAG: GntR family transcriptional regulator [Clostridiaceae bacterium]|nr:GntR family transcriptional regulator [Clostridiaceae bacterium]
MNVELKPVDPQDLRPIRDIVFESIRHAIFDGKLKKGDHLVESAVAEKMKVSRTPVREALRQLESEGLVVNVPRKGAVVQGISKEDAIEIYDLREVLEGLVARLACLNITDEDIDRLKYILQEMKTTIENNHDDKLVSFDKEYNMLHMEYNSIILNSSKSQRLQTMMKNIYDYLTSLRSVSLYKKDRRLIALKEHREIVKAFEERNEDEAENLVRKHVKKAKEAFLNNAPKE